MSLHVCVSQYCSDISKFLILPGLNESSIVIREDSLIGDTDVMSDIVVMLPLLFVHQGDERFDVQIGTEPGVVIPGCVSLPESPGHLFPA